MEFTCVCTSIYMYLWIASHFLDQRPSTPVNNRSYVLSSHGRLPFQMDLPTAETDVRSVGVECYLSAVTDRTGRAVED